MGIRSEENESLDSRETGYLSEEISKMLRITEAVRGMSDEERAMTTEHALALEQTTLAPRLNVIYDEICDKGAGQSSG